MEMNITRLRNEYDVAFQRLRESVDALNASGAGFDAIQQRVAEVEANYVSARNAFACALLELRDETPDDPELECAVCGNC